MVAPQGKIGLEDIEVIWTTLGGRIRTEDDAAEEHDFIIAAIKVTENEKLIFKVSFAKKLLKRLKNFSKGISKNRIIVESVI